MSAYTVGFWAIGEWLGHWKRLGFYTEEGSPKDIARKEWRAMHEVNKQKFFDVGKFRSGSNSEVLKGIEEVKEKTLFVGSVYQGGVVEAVDQKVSYLH